MTLPDEMQGELNEKISETMASSQFICIYGMAIGVTDSRWWREILKWLGSENHELFIYWYKDKGVRENKYLHDMILERLFRHSGDELDDAKKSILSKRIHILYIDQDTFREGVSPTKMN